MVKAYYRCELCDTGYPTREGAETCEDVCRKERQQKKDAMKGYHVVSDIIVDSFAVITCCGCGKTFRITCSCNHGRIERTYWDDEEGLACPHCDKAALLDEDATQTFFAEWAE